MDQYNHFTVFAWMVNELGLKTIERDCFAVIYGFSQDGSSDFHASMKYIIHVTGYSRNAICRALQNLTDKKLVVKKEKTINNVKECRYTINWKTVHQMDHQIDKNDDQTVHPTCTPVHPTCTRNKDNRKIENKKILSKDKIQPESFLGSLDRDKVPKQSLYEKCINYIDSFTQDPAIRSSLVKFLDNLLQMSKQDNRTLYYNMFVARINKLNEFEKEEWPEIIEATLKNSWKNFYKPENNSRGSKKGFQDNAVSESYTDDELAELDRINKERESHGLQTKF